MVLRGPADGLEKIHPSRFEPELGSGQSCHVEQIVNEPCEKPRLPSDYGLRTGCLIAGRFAALEDVKAVSDRARGCLSSWESIARNSLF